ncbi:MAG: TolC family protein [Ahrensia sp.]|nr:TolC family protein [Ahrensia sp.]
MRTALMVVCALTVSACAIKPDPLTTSSLKSFASDKLARVTADQEPITTSVTLYEAMARALKYNLDFKLELYNEALASRQLDSARLDTLPKLAASVGHYARNNDSGGLDTTIFPDRRTFEEDIVLSWNILDLGLSKVRAQQAADEVLIARERRRKIVNKVIEDVRSAYWRAVSADRLLAGLRKLEARSQSALKNSRALQRDGQTSPLTALTYQRELVEIQQRIQRLQKDLAQAKLRLASLMNVRPGTRFELAQPKRRVDSTKLPLTAQDMVFAALENRPEIRDVQYRMRINAKEGQRALLELLPGVNLFATANWNSDDYLLNSNWIGWGAKATFNLLNVFKYPTKKRLIAAKDDVLDAQALAVTMSIMTQVHVSRVRYWHARKTYQTAATHLKVQKGILRQIRASAREGQASEQTLIREELNTLASEVTADVAYTDLQNAYANVYESIGIDPYTDETFANDDLTVLTKALEREWFERGDQSGLARAKKAARDHTVTGSVRSPAKPAIDDIEGLIAANAPANAANTGPTSAPQHRRAGTGIFALMSKSGPRRTVQKRRTQTR